MQVCKLQILRHIKSATQKCQGRNTSISHVIPLIKLLELDLSTLPTVRDFPAVQKAIYDGIISRTSGLNLFLNYALNIKIIEVIKIYYLKAIVFSRTNILIIMKKQ